MSRREMNKNITIREMKRLEIPLVARVHRECFPDDAANFKNAVKWITCNYWAKPRMVYYIAAQKNKILGFALWLEMGGFRKKALLELEQVGVVAKMRGNGIGTTLIKESLKQYAKKYIFPRPVKLIKVTTAAKNKAQRVYQRALGAKPECVLKKFFDGDELIMIARNVKL